MNHDLTPLELAALASYAARQDAVSALIEGARQPERYKGDVLPVGIKAAQLAEASRTMQRKRDAEPVQNTMFSECSEQVSLF